MTDTVTMVLDGAGLHAQVQDPPPAALLEALEVAARAGKARLLVPSAVTVEALTGGARDAPVNQLLKTVEVDEHLPVERTRVAARLRQGTDASAVDALVAEAAVRTRAAYLVTSDPDDMKTLLGNADYATHVVVV